MTSVGLELTSFIDPSLTWKTVSKGRSTSRRSRNMKLIQEQGKRSPKRLNSLRSSEDSEKAKVMSQERCFAGNMELIPIKKRRLFYRSPSPPLQSPSCQGESEGVVSGQDTLDQCTVSNVSVESQAMQNNVSNGSRSKNTNSDGNIDKSNGVKSSNEVHDTGGDFSGIDILAAAACSDQLDNSGDDAGKRQSQIGGIFDKKHESFGAASDVKENITKIQSLELLEKDTKYVEGVCVVDLPKDNLQSSVDKESDDFEMSCINESQKAEQYKSVAFTSVGKESLECVSSPDSLRNNVVKESISDLPNEVADRTPENSGTNQDCRFLWDLNTVMVEWDDPVEDVVTSAQALEVAPMNIMDLQNLEDVNGSKANESEIQNIENVEGLEARRAETSECYDNVTFQVEVCAKHERIGSGAGFTSISPTISRVQRCSEVLSGFVTNIFKENPSPLDANDQVAETPVLVTDCKIQHMGVNADAKIDHSLSLGLNGVKKEISNESASENANQVPEEIPRLQIVPPEKHEFCSLLAPLLENASIEVKAADCKKNDNVVNVACQPTSPISLGSCTKLEITALSTSKSEEFSCKVNDLNSNSLEPEKVMSLVDNDCKHWKVIGRSLECQFSCPENQKSELKDSCGSLCSSKLDIFTTSTTMGNDQAMDRVIANKIAEKPAVTCAFESDPIIHNGSKEPVPKILDHCVAVDACSESIDDHFVEKSLCSGHGSHVSNEDSSQVTENTVIVTEIGGYDSHLEDGEFREPHCWEDNEGEEVETEHVDYDSDNRDGIVFYEAASDFVQLSGEVLVGECEKQSCRSDNFSSDDQPNPDKSYEKNCSLRFQGCLSTKDSTEAVVCTKRESPALKACFRAVNSDKVDIDLKDCRSSIETDSVGKDFENDPPRNVRGGSASGRDLQFSVRRYADSMHRSRSSNFDCMHSSDGRDESRSQQPSMRMDRFGGRSWNLEHKSIVGNSVSEDDSERIIRTTGDTSPLRSRRPRIINTSRGGYHFVRRGSTGEREGDYGTEIMKVRDFSPDNNPRNRFGRFNGMSRGGFGEGYRRPNVYDPPKSGGRGSMMNRCGKKERSISPVGNRFHRKSRSPDFRPEARMGRGRLPYQQSNHVAEHPRERRSLQLRVFNQTQRFEPMGSPGRLRSDDCIRPPMCPMRFHDTTTSGRSNGFDEGDNFRRKPILIRNHRRSRSRSRTCSPDFRSDTRMGPMRIPYQPSGDHIRERSSAVRVFRPDQRFESGVSPVRRTDDCPRPMMRPLRFPDSSQPGRGHDFNTNNINADEYQRKPRTIFERIHPIRQYDIEGDIRRFPCDEEGASTQNFRRNENYVRGPGERRPVEFRGPREERSNIRYNNSNSDRVFYSGPKQQFGGGVRQYGSDEGIARRVRP